MENKTYISQQDLDKFLSYLKLNKIWNYYLIVYNLAYSDKTYIELQKGDTSEIIVPEGIPYPKENPFSINNSVSFFPINPVPPVNNTFFFITELFSHFEFITNINKYFV